MRTGLIIIMTMFFVSLALDLAVPALILVSLLALDWLSAQVRQGPFWGGENSMKWFLILWACPVLLLTGWYGLSYYDMNFGIFMLTRQAHDLVFAVYGNGARHSAGNHSTPRRARNCGR